MESIELEAKVFKGLSDKSRLSILVCLLHGSQTVTDLVEETGLSQPNVSAHLSCLTDCGLTRKEKKGREMYYRIAAKEVADIIGKARSLLRKNAKAIYHCTTY